MKKYEKYKNQVVFSSRHFFSARVSSIESMEEMFEAILFLQNDEWYYFDEKERIFKLTDKAPSNIVEYYNDFYRESDLEDIRLQIEKENKKKQKLQEVLEVFEVMRKKMSDEDIIKALVRMYYDDKIEYGLLLELVEILGYEFNDEYKERIKDKKFNI